MARRCRRIARRAAKCGRRSRTGVLPARRRRRHGDRRQRGSGLRQSGEFRRRRIRARCRRRARRGVADRRWLGLDTVATAAGIHRIINARMADEVRRVSVQRGYDPRQFALLPLGGGGPVHAGAIAAELGMPRIVVPESPGVLSAFGLLVAAIEARSGRDICRAGRSHRAGRARPGASPARRARQREDGARWRGAGPRGAARLRRHALCRPILRACRRTAARFGRSRCRRRRRPFTRCIIRCMDTRIREPPSSS